jgi:hypothetical protein
MNQNILHSTLPNLKYFRFPGQLTRHPAPAPRTCARTDAGTFFCRHAASFGTILSNAKYFGFDRPKCYSSEYFRHLPSPFSNQIGNVLVVSSQIQNIFDSTVHSTAYRLVYALVPFSLERCSSPPFMVHTTIFTRPSPS